MTDPILPKESPQKSEPAQSRIEALILVIKETVAKSSVPMETLEKIKAGYTGLTKLDKPRFFQRLLESVEVDAERLSQALTNFPDPSADPQKWRASLVELRSRIESPRWRLFRHFIRLPGGLKFLLDFRADVLSAQRLGYQGLDPLDNDLIRLFESWFQYGFLYLDEITLESPYRQVQFIMSGDMVHPMTSLDEMQWRLGKDRRCFALYHRAMPDEPVVFIEVALTNGVVRSVHEIITHNNLVEGKASAKDTAVFYSINNTQNGLAGLGLGNLLIFQVVDFLKNRENNIRNFCTLSPMPGFWRRYLKPLLEGHEGFMMNIGAVEKLFDKKTIALLETEHVKRGGSSDDSFAEILLGLFSDTKWSKSKALVQGLTKPLTRLGYIYLAEEKDQTGRPLDPVANFHIGNGASLRPANVNFGANCSEIGLERSLSLMVNYIYTQTWMRQIRDSMGRLGGLLPGLASRGTRRYDVNEDEILE